MIAKTHFVALFALLTSPFARAAGITEYPLPVGSAPNFLAIAKDGAVLFTEYGTDHIGS